MCTQSIVVLRCVLRKPWEFLDPGELITTRTTRVAFWDLPSRSKIWAALPTTLSTGGSAQTLGTEERGQVEKEKDRKGGMGAEDGRGGYRFWLPWTNSSETYHYGTEQLSKQRGNLVESMQKLLWKRG